MPGSSGIRCRGARIWNANIIVVSHAGSKNGSTPITVRAFCAAIGARKRSRRRSIISTELALTSSEWPLEKIVHSWKRQSAVRINRLTDSTGALWQRDYFDRLVRNEQHFARCVRYIRSNPEKARLRPGEYILYESDIARAVGEAV